MKDTILFDLDGTLVNSLKDLFTAVNYALDKCNYPLRTIDEVRAFVGNGIRVLIERSVPNNSTAEDTAKCLDIFKEYYLAHYNVFSTPYKDIISMLKKLKESGYKIAVCSNKFLAGVNEICSKLFGNLIDVALGESSSVAKKPAPEMIELALNKLVSNKKSAVYVGDSEVDVITAKNADIDFIGVTWGFRDREILSALGAKTLISSPLEIFDCLLKF